jgi:hypothetical protein
MARVVSLAEASTHAPSAAAPEAQADASLDAVRVVRGRAPAPGANDEVLVSGSFAEANALQPGDGLVAVVDAQQVRAARPVRAFVLYAPPMADNDADVRVYPDRYGHDAAGR